MKVVVNPAYSHLSDFIHKIPGELFSDDSVIRDTRNTLRKVTVDGYTMVIKQYKKPISLNRFVYSFIRKTKARRSYEYALRLQEMGIGTADPIAYIEQKKGGLFHTGYFISLFLSYPLMDSYHKENKDVVTRLLDDFVDFTVSIHERGVVHCDYNLSNILYHKIDDSYQFSLIDINRMKFNEYSKRKCEKVLMVMGFDLPSFTTVGENYANKRGWNAELFCGTLMLMRGRDNIRRRRKRKIKKFLGLSHH